MLNISNYIQLQVQKTEPGRVIQMNDFKIPAGKRMAIAKELSRLVQKGILNRLEKGKYFKPRQTTFGLLKPSDNEVINTILVATNGYLCGVGAFNSLGLTSQVANTIEIAASGFRTPKEIAGLKIKFRRSAVNATHENKEILQILDAIRYIKKIPDSSPDDALRVIISKIRSMSLRKKQLLLKCSRQYNPATRALIGAVFEQTCGDISVEALYKTLNPLSCYRLGISDSVLPNKSKWKIE